MKQIILVNKFTKRAEYIFNASNNCQIKNNILYYQIAKVDGLHGYQLFLTNYIINIKY